MYNKSTYATRTLLFLWRRTEKNATKWSNEKLTELLVGVEAKDASGEATISEVDSITGDAIAKWVHPSPLRQPKKMPPYFSAPSFLSVYPIMIL